jgi:hypothetical protein
MSPERIDVGELPEEAHARLIHLSNVFGRVLFDTARSPSPKDGESLPEAANTEAAAVVDRTLYGALQVLDGVTPPIGNEDLDIEFVLTARVSDRATGQLIDEIELGPNGEGLCMGFHGWVEGDFGSVPI